MKISIIQLNSQNDKSQNLWQAEQMITKAYAQDEPDLIALPEMFTLMGGSLEEKKAAAEIISGNESQTAGLSLLKQLARQFKVYIHGGSLCEYQSGRYYNTSCIINPEGDLIAAYRKMNLFCFTGSSVKNSTSSCGDNVSSSPGDNSPSSRGLSAGSSNQLTYNEGLFFTPGNQVITYQVGDIRIGCAICFDLRFSSMFTQLITEDVAIIIVPSAFTYETGQAHWELLCRSRAIETQAFIIAPAQTGTYHENGIEKACWGHSMIVDPWGNILAKLNEEPGFAAANLDFDFLAKVRARLPLRNVAKLSECDS